MGDLLDATREVPADYAARTAEGLTAIAPFQRWLEKMGFVENGKLTKKAGDGSALLKEVRHG